MASTVSLTDPPLSSHSSTTNTTITSSLAAWTPSDRPLSTNAPRHRRPAAALTSSPPTTPNQTPTPTPTPTTARASQMSSQPSSQSTAFNSQPGLMPAPNQLSGPSINGSFSDPAAANPQIYTALYSGISVYEMETNNIIVMRRRADSWLNATQILKVAGVEKAKRTKILEKEVLNGEHEKVQGGYGKYQGTWVNYPRGVAFCRQYQVEELLRPLLEYDMGQDGVSAAGQGLMETPTKEQAQAAMRKRRYAANGADNRAPSRPTNGTYFKAISTTASNAVAAINKARVDPFARQHRPAAARKPATPRRPSAIDPALMAHNGQPSMRPLASDGIEEPTRGLDAAYPVHAGPEMLEPPRKRVRSSAQLDSSFRASHEAACLDVSMPDAPAIAPHESLRDLAEQGLASASGIVSLPPLPRVDGLEGEEKLSLLREIFLRMNALNADADADRSMRDAIRQLSPTDLERPVDVAGHTALHWSATLACLPLARLLIAGGASIFRVSAAGESALMRGCLSTNCLDRGNFPELLELLGPTIEMRDNRDRTVLHHIVITSAIKGRSAASKYYLESLLEYVVRQGSAHASQQTSFAAGHAASAAPAPPTAPPISLTRFMFEVVNARDKSGDTALNIAARTGNQNIIQQLLEVGADARIPNRAGLKPLDFGVGADGEGEGEGEGGGVPTDSTGPTHDADGSNSAAVAASQEVQACTSSFLSQAQLDHQIELRVEQSLMDAVRSEIRVLSGLVADERQKVEACKKRLAQRAERKQRIVNLRRATDGHALSLVTDPTDHSNRNRANINLTITNGHRDTAHHLHLPMPANADADAGMEILADVFPVDSIPHDDMAVAAAALRVLDDQPGLYLARLPPPTVLRARLAAYVANNQRLRERVAALRSRSAAADRMYRRTFALCTGLDEAAIEQLLGGLVAALESEGPESVGVNRVSDFLRKVGGVAP